MTKRTTPSAIRAIPLLILLGLLLTGCGCKHEWTEANCDTPKTCSACGETEGEALGHAWIDASCETPKTCSACNKTEGEALGHKWEDATTEAPKTCSACQKTEGERIITDARFKTAACKDFFGTWKGIVNMPMKELIAEDYNGTLDLEYTIIFNHDGTYSEAVVMLNKDAFNKELEDYYTKTLYEPFISNGMTQAQADEAMQSIYGMDVKAYAKVLSVAVNWEAMFAAVDATGVYYVADGKLYNGKNWEDQLSSDNYTLSDSKLTIESLTADFPGLVFTYVSQ